MWPVCSVTYVAGSTPRGFLLGQCAVLDTAWIPAFARMTFVGERMTKVWEASLFWWERPPGRDGFWLAFRGGAAAPAGLGYGYGGVHFCVISASMDTTVSILRC